MMAFGVWAYPIKISFHLILHSTSERSQHVFFLAFLSISFIAYIEKQLS